MGHITLICKPTHACNLNCTYCYDKTARAENLVKWTMDTVDRMAYLMGNSCDYINFNWHGGECMTMGVDWIVEATKLMKNVVKTMNPRSELNFGLQSNGLLLTEEAIDKLLAEGIYPAISFDGLGQYRRTPNPIQSKIIQKHVQTLGSKIDGTLNIAVIDKENIDTLIENYEYMKEIGSVGISYNNVFPAHIEGDTQRNNKFITKWQEFFDHWFWDKNGIQERSCIALLSRFFNSEEDLTCSQGVCVGEFLSVDSDGNIWPCDSTFNEAGEEYKLGNIYDDNLTSFFDVLQSDAFIKYKARIIAKNIKCMSKCEYYQFCKGGCPAQALAVTGAADGFDIQMCEWTAAMVDHIYEVIKDLSTEDLMNINPTAYNILAKNGYLSLTDIKECIAKSMEME